MADHPEEYQRLMNSFLIKVTEFFRDSDLFDHLRSEVLPQLIQGARPRGNELRLWSAGCATGEEAYSLTIMVAEALGEELETLNEELQATIEELNTTTEDQQARGRELQGEAQDGLRRQRWLYSILEGLELALIVVDSSGAIMLRTTEYEKMFGEAAPEFLNADASTVSAEASPVSRAARGERFTEQYLLATDGGRRRYEISGWPIDESESGSGGALLVRDLGAAETQDQAR